MTITKQVLNEKLAILNRVSARQYCIIWQYGQCWLYRMDKDGRGPSAVVTSGTKKEIAAAIDVMADALIYDADARLA